MTLIDRRPIEVNERLSKIETADDPSDGAGEK